MAEGKSVPLGKWRFGDYEVEAWQRKNAEIREPFATGLFLRHGTNQWQVFCLDIQDTYRPSIELRNDAAEVEVFRNSKHIGSLDLANGSFRRNPGGPPFTPGGIGRGERPPGEWWLKK